GRVGGGRAGQATEYGGIRNCDGDLGDFVFFRSRKGNEVVAEEKELGWGFLVNLQNAQTYDLKAEHISIGRDVKGIGNDISFPNQLVSRQHLIINRNGNVSDLRSTNGTTINANVLPYGVGGELLDNDILVLANVEALQFRNKNLRSHSMFLSTHGPYSLMASQGTIFT